MIANAVSYHVSADKPDDRDYEYRPDAALGALPSEVDLRTAPCGFPPVFDQGRLNSCTANAVCAVLAYDIRGQLRDDTFVPSRLFVYYNERYREDAIGQASYGDHGAPAYMRDCIKVVDKNGFCSEDEWPYDQSRFDMRPPESAYQSAVRHRSCEYFRIPQDPTLMKSCLAEGYPFVCGIVVYESFLSDDVRRTGIVPLPQEEPKIGGHALAVVGYDDAKERFIIRNSLGGMWGEGGHGSIPYAYLANPAYAMDFWVLRKVLAGEPPMAPA